MRDDSQRILSWQMEDDKHYTREEFFKKTGFHTRSSFYKAINQLEKGGYIARDEQGSFYKTEKGIKKGKEIKKGRQGERT